MNISKATVQGQRDYQEDRFVVSNHPNGKLIAVMDGHGGASVSSKLANLLPRVFRKHAATAAYPEQLLIAVFAELNENTKHMDEGSTISIVWIPNVADKVYIGIVGDSPVLVLDKDGNLHVSPMHNARSNPAELEAAKKRGAYFYGGYISAHFSGHGIQMTRVFGDASLAKIVNREPEVYSVELGKDSVVIVGSDGLFDPAHQDVSTMAQVIMELANVHRYSAGDLTRYAELKPTYDNATAI